MNILVDIGALFNEPYKLDRPIYICVQWKRILIYKAVEVRKWFPTHSKKST